MRPLLTLLTGLAGLAFAPLALSADTHCTSQESTLFNCTTGKKTVSVCASKNLSRSSGYLQYRFGAKGKPEIEIPEAREYPGPTVKSGTLASSGGAYLRFYKAEYTYVVYAASDKNGGKTDEGVGTKAGKDAGAKTGKDVPAKADKDAGEKKNKNGGAKAGKESGAKTDMDGGMKAGVVVEKGNQLVANIPCKKPAQSEIGPKLFEKAGLAADEKTFKLP